LIFLYSPFNQIFFKKLVRTKKIETNTNVYSTVTSNAWSRLALHVSRPAIAIFTEQRIPPETNRPIYGWAFYKAPGSVLKEKRVGKRPPTVGWPLGLV
jgi:hypothetical protein